MERNTKFHKTADTITVKLKFLLFSAIIAFLFPVNASAYVVKYKEDYYRENGKEPDISWIAKELNCSEFDISNALQALKDPISMYEAIYNDGGDTIYLYDQIEDKANNTDISNRLAVQNAIDDLEKREKYILDERFIIGKSQMEIAKELSISQAQVSRLEKKAIKQLKKVLR